jgi:hypothetical protein
VMPLSMRASILRGPRGDSNEFPNESRTC